MNEFDELHHALAADTEPPTADELQNARARLTRAIASEAATAQRRGRPSWRRPLVLAAGTTALVAAVVAIVLAAASGGTPSTSPSHRPVRHVTTTPAKQHITTTPTNNVDLPPLRHPTAKQVLDRAAAVALRAPAVMPSPDQFIYTRIEQSGGKIGQTWSSVSGRRDSLEYTPGSKTATKLPGCTNGHHHFRQVGKDGKPISDFIPRRILERWLRHPPTRQESERIYERFFGQRTLPMDGPAFTVRCTPQPAFFPGMPTTTDKLMRYLEKTQGVYTQFGTAQDDNELGKQAEWILQTYYLLPTQQAALFRLLAVTPGFTIKRSVRDAAGRRGIGIQWKFEGSSAYLIFSTKTYRFLGFTTIGLQGQVGGIALLQTAIVNHLGQEPAQTQQGEPAGSTA